MSHPTWFFCSSDIKGSVSNSFWLSAVFLRVVGKVCGILVPTPVMVLKAASHAYGNVNKREVSSPA